MMVAIYARWIMAGRITLKDVPEMWREAVRQKLAAEI